MYHLELRQFPHNLCRFNLTEEELGPIVDPWARERVVEVGERKWSPHQAKLTILEGPALAMEQLAMGRGWRAAQRQSEDVTERVLVAATAVGAGASLSPALDASADADLPRDPQAPGMLADLRSVAALLGPDATALLEAWRTVAAGSPGLAPSASLALAEAAIRRADGSQR